MGERGLLLAARWFLAVSMTFALLRGCRALTPPGCPVIKGEPTLPQRSTADHNDRSLAGSFFLCERVNACARAYTAVSTGQSRLQFMPGLHAARGEHSILVTCARGSSKGNISFSSYERKQGGQRVCPV